MVTNLFKLDKFLDALKEVGNMGAGKASGALSRLVDRKVSLHTPEIFLTKTTDIPELIGGPQELVVGIYDSLKGDVAGSLLFVLPTKAAMSLADLLQGKKIGETKTLEKTAQTKLKEVGETLSKYYVSSITEFLKIKVERTEERIISTFGESLPDLVLLGITEKYALFISTNFEIPETEIKGKFIMLIAMDSVSKMVEAIKKQVA
jgi:chemotaxis protein CheC